MLAHKRKQNTQPNVTDMMLLISSMYCTITAIQLNKSVVKRVQATAWLTFCVFCLTRPFSADYTRLCRVCHRSSKEGPWMIACARCTGQKSFRAPK